MSRHFVRDALAEAIKSLNEASDIADAARPEVTLDHDRKGVPGSPDLARTIFDKIAKSDVFVADVTPVGRVSGKRPKRLINSNVAIELGYALATVTDRGLLMIFNEHFGALKDLPFDLRHKAGPITYRLSPEATVDEITETFAKLVGRLKVALREMRPSAVSLPPAPPYVRVQAIDRDPARYVRPGETLATHRGPDLEFRYAMPSGAAVYLRLIPNQSLPKLKHADAYEIIRRGPDSLEPFAHPHSSYGPIVNAQGALSYSTDRSSQDLVVSGSQLFATREIWGFDTSMLSDAEGRRIERVPMLALERTYAIALRQYVILATRRLGLTPPFTVIGGATGVQDMMLALGPLKPGGWPQPPWGPILVNHIEWQGELDSTEPQDVDRVLLSIFEAYYDSVGRHRPPDMYGFPGPTPGAVPQ